MQGRNAISSYTQIVKPSGAAYNSTVSSTHASRQNRLYECAGILSAHLDLAEEDGMFGLERNLPEKVHARNKQVFALGRQVGSKIVEG